MASHDFAVIELFRNIIPRKDEHQVMIIAKKKTDCKTVMLYRYLLVHLNINLFLFGSLFELSNKTQEMIFSGLFDSVRVLRLANLKKAQNVN